MDFFRLLRSVSCVLLLALSSPLPAPASESLSVIPDTAEALGMVGGRFANLQDASALRISPANIADFEQPELLISSAMWRGDIKFNSTLANTTIANESRWVFPASLYAVIPLEPGRVAVGFGISTPHGIGSSYPRNSSLRYVVPYESSLLTVNLTPAVAWRANDQWSFGLGFEVMFGRLQINQMIPLGPADGEFQFDGEGWGLGGYMGTTWNITPHQRLSLVGRLPLKVRFEGDFEAQGIPAGLGLGLANRSDFESDMTFPGSIALGYGIDVTDRLTLGADFKWSANSSHDDIPLRTSNSFGLLPTQAVELDYRNSIDLGVGASYALSRAWTLRSGYLFSENSMPDSTYTPAIANNDRHVFSLGVGRAWKSRSIDLTYAFVFNPKRTVTGANVPLLNGNYKHQWHVVSISFTQRF